MPSELEELAATARELAEIAADRREGERAGRLAERLAAGRFLISVVGEFKRGKSTLINALLGASVVPTGVVPLTAVATEVDYGDPSVEVELLDGTHHAIDSGELADWVTEARNPGNTRGVARVVVRGRWPLLAAGVVLVDTPGIASLFRHNTEAAKAALLDADGAVVVLSADAPVSESERDLLVALAERQAPTFFVLNKADHLAADELDEVRRFVEGALCDVLGRNARLFAVGARAALADRAAGCAASSDAGEFAAFAEDLERFINDDLVVARLSTARAELARLGETLRDGLNVEQAALELDVEALARQVRLFAEAAERQRQAFEDDRTLLARDVARLADDLADRLATFAREAPAEHVERLAQVAASAPRAHLADELEAVVESAVRDTFEAFRRREADRTEQAWRSLAEAFRRRTAERVGAARDAAADLFAVPMPQVQIPSVAAERERFFYLFIHVGGFSDPLDRLAARLVPGRIARARELARARRHLIGEFDKHAGRARWDLTQRLEAVRLRFEIAMCAELDATIDAIVEAAARAADVQRAAAEDRAGRSQQTDRERRLAVALIELGTRP